MQKIEHIGIAVASLEQSIQKYELLLGVSCYKVEEVASEAVKTAFFMVGDTKIELLEGTTEESVISKYVLSKGEGIHHIAYGVVDIKEEMVRLKNEGFRVLNEEPKAGADNKWVCFVHPKDANGVLTELCQERN
jgi:methylmalonyl-CoA/ethylmalonyl-CoA epimerase